MSTAGLRRQLWRMGRASARRDGGGGQVRGVALLLAAALLALGLSAVVAVFASYDGIRTRAADRGLQFQEAFPDRKPVALSIDGFDETGGLQHSLVHLRPLSKDAPLPPGVDHWPAPGEAVLSPGLVRALKAEGSLDRYGRISGTIHDEGLASPGERFGYVNPRPGQINEKAELPVVGFGGPIASSSGDPLFIQDRGRFVMALYLILLPTAVLAVVAARMGSAGRDKRTALVSALGGGWQARTWLNLGESTLPVAAGAVLGALPGLLVAATGDIRLPWIGYWLSAADLRRWWWGLALSGVVSAVALLLLVCLLHRTGRRAKARSTRLAARGSQVIRWAATASPLLVFATVWGPAQLDPAQYADLRMKLYNTGVAAVLVTLPCAVAVAGGAIGGRLAQSARRTGSPGALVAGRHAAAHPGVTARLVAGVGIAMVLVSQVQLTSLQFGESARAARATADRIGTSALLLDIRPDRVSPQRMKAVIDHLPPGAVTLSVYQPDRRFDEPVLLQGPCRALRAVGLPCIPGTTKAMSEGVDKRIVEAVRWTGPIAGRFEVKEGAVVPGVLPVPHGVRSGATTSGSGLFLLVAEDGGNLPEDRVRQLLRNELPVASASVGPPGASWLVSSNLSVAHGRWVIFFGVPGVLILALAVALANLAEFLRFSRMVAPLSVLTGKRKVYYSTAAWGLLAPLLAAIAASLIAAVWLAVPQENPAEGIELSGAMLTGTAAALGVLSVLTWWWGSRAAIRQSTLWRPYGD
ncbi:permease [Streptomyces griseocarneus]|nr:permease [Streptomyces griseocarneus]